MTLPTSAQKRPGDRVGGPFPAGGHVGIGRAHGKAILLGEHAVVYGAPALAVPVPELAVTATAARSPHAPADGREVTFTMTESASGSASGPVVMQATDGWQRLVSEFTETTGIAVGPHLDVFIDCAVPPGRGLGSSAACARAVVLALADLFGRGLDGRTVFDIVQAAENVAHGRSSGVDALATGSPTPILFSGGTAEEPRVGLDAVFVIADSGVAGRTKDAVAMLRRGFEEDAGSREEFVGRVETLTRAAVRDLAEGRAGDFGGRLTENHELLRGVGVSTDLIDTLVDTALAAGSLGAKISGGGLGGCMIAMAGDPGRADEVARRLRDAGAARTWTVSLERSAGHAR